MSGDIWANDTLSVGGDGRVEGAARTIVRAGHDVQVTVTSYEYDRGGETHINHVPHVAITDETGRVVDEIEVHDSEVAATAIESGKNTAADAIKNIEDYV